MDRRALVLALLLASSAGAASAGEPARMLPSCTLTSLDGERTFELDQLRGSILWVDFWASWCDSCAASFSFLESLDRQFASQGLRVLAINLDEDPADAEDFLARHPARVEQAADRSGSCPRRFGIPGMPAAYLIDREGIIRHQHLGFRAGDAGRIRGLVGELVAAEAKTPHPPEPDTGLR